MSEHDDWDSHWKRYADAARHNPAQQMRHRIIVKLLKQNEGRKIRVLDIGSGQGDLLVKFHEERPDAELLGFELSVSGVEISKAKLPQAKFFVADLFHPPDELRAYAGWATEAVCSEVLEHVDSPVDFIKAFLPYLAAGARLVVTVPGGPMSAFDRHIGHRQHFNCESIRGFLADAGLSTERVYLSGFPFFNLYRWVVIARGDKLAADVNAGHGGFSAWLAGVVMIVFRGLFRLNLMNSWFGWQVVAIARKPRQS